MEDSTAPPGSPWMDDVLEQKTTSLSGVENDFENLGMSIFITFSARG
jgi:hypothetical protein